MNNIQVIRDEELAGLFMIPIFTSMNIHRCNVAGCSNKPTTYIPDYEIGICEPHYQEAKEKGKWEYKLER